MRFTLWRCLHMFTQVVMVLRMVMMSMTIIYSDGHEVDDNNYGDNAWGDPRCGNDFRWWPSGYHDVSQRSWTEVLLMFFLLLLPRRLSALLSATRPVGAGHLQSFSTCKTKRRVWRVDEMSSAQHDLSSDVSRTRTFGDHMGPLSKAVQNLICGFA